MTLSGLGITTATGGWPAIPRSGSGAGHSAADHQQCQRNEWLALATDPMVRLQMAGLSSAECTHFHAHTHLHLHQEQQQQEAAAAAAGNRLLGKESRRIRKMISDVNLFIYFFLLHNRKFILLKVKLFLQNKKKTKKIIFSTKMKKFM